ncbi:nucleic-acid-binding protein from transposon X-element [Trichonephila clavipes]|nr:nucleic-acid-binding protein from transposon X-element [Trichonephila clavipes]
MEPISSYITKLARNVFRSIENHDNPIIRAQTMFTYPHPKLKYAYATAKWQLPLKPQFYNGSVRFQDRCAGYIVRKTDGALDDVQKLRLISEVQYVALKVSRKSIRLQNRKFKDYIEQIKVLNEKKILTPPSPSKAKKRIRNKGTTVSLVPGTKGKNEGNPPPSRDSADGKGNLTDTEDEGFSVVSRRKKIASIVIDASNNTTELLTTLGDYLGSTLEGRFENGKLRVFPKTHLEHRKLQSYLAQKKMRSHTFEMADNKQLKAVIRGLPTDYDQKEIATELKGFGFSADHISILRNRKNNTNMPLFLVVLKRTQENKEIFHVTNIGFFRVVVEPLKGSSMPPQCYRCQEFYHHSHLCNRAPKCLKCSGGHLTAECK